jgi:hypothetical protein
MYNPTRLEWHLGDESYLEPRRVLCGLVVRQASLLITFNRLAVALAKSQDHRASCGVFVFGQRNAVRRWLRLRYPVTRASQSRGRGLIARARWLKQSGIVRCDDMAPKSNIEAQANFGFDHGKAVLCSNIHQRAKGNTDETVQMRWNDKGTSTNRK